VDAPAYKHNKMDKQTVRQIGRQNANDGNNSIHLLAAIISLTLEYNERSDTVISCDRLESSETLNSSGRLDSSKQQ